MQVDKAGYLAKTFSLQTVPKDIAAAITAKDPGPLAFHKMTLAVTPKFVALAPGSVQPNYHLKWTLLNAGGPFVQYLEEQNSNGIDTRQDYGISYRNIQPVRLQVMQLDHTGSTLVMEMKSLADFTPVAPERPGNRGCGRSLHLGQSDSARQHVQPGHALPVW